MYGDVGRSTGAYGARLQSISNIDTQIGLSRESYEYEAGERESMYKTLSSGLELFSAAYGGYKAKKESAAAREALGKSEYESSLKKDISDWGEDVGEDVKGWGDLSPLEKSEWLPQQTYGETKIWDLIRGKAKIGEGETKWGEAGERLDVLFGGGERKYDWGGKEWSESELLAKHKLDRASERGISKDGLSDFDFQFTSGGDGQTMAKESDLGDKVSDELGPSPQSVPSFPQGDIIPPWRKSHLAENLSPGYQKDFMGPLRPIPGEMYENYGTWNNPFKGLFN